MGDVDEAHETIGLTEHFHWFPVEVSRSVDRRLLGWCRSAAEELDVQGLARGQVVEALIEQLLQDEHTSKAVRERLADQLKLPHPRRSR